MIVQLTSRTMLPWVCTGLRLRRAAPGIAARRRSSPRSPRCRPRPRPRRTAFIRSRILRAAGPAGCSEFWPLSGPAAAAAREHDDRRRHRRRLSRLRAGAVACGPTSAFPRGAGSSGVPARGDSTLADSPDRNSVIRAVFRSLTRPRRSSDAGRRCQSRSTRTWVSRCTRTPSSASNSRRASVPAWRSTAPPRPITMPRCDVALDADDQPEREQGPVLGLALLELLGRHRDRVGQLVVHRAEQLLAQQLGGEDASG